MNRKPVRSTNIVSIGYDSDTSVLEIEFYSREVYQYTNIPQRLFDDFMTSQSLGRYFAQNIKGKFSFRKM